MKKAEEYVEKIGHGLYTSYCVRDKNAMLIPVMSIENAKKAIKQAQEDAIREAVKECADSAYAEEAVIGYGWYVNSDSILRVADELIKEL